MRPVLTLLATLIAGSAVPALADTFSAAVGLDYSSGDYGTGTTSDAAILAALGCVSLVVPFEDDTPYALTRTARSTASSNCCGLRKAWIHPLRTIRFCEPLCSINSECSLIECSISVRKASAMA